MQEGDLQPPDNRSSGDLKSSGNRWAERAREWRAPLATLAGGVLVFLTLSGLSIWLAPFNLPNQVMVLVHTVAGIAFLIPLCWYLVRHWLKYWRSPMSHIQLMGYFGCGAILLALASGLVLTYQAALGIKISYAWDSLHIIGTFAAIAFNVPHVLLIIFRDRKAAAISAVREVSAAAGHYGRAVLIYTLGALAIVALAAYAYQPVRLQNEFPMDYSYKYGTDRPFAPSLVTTSTGQAMDARLLSGSRSCGTSGCHEQIVQEWEVSAHRYSAMDLGFQKVQMAMAQQNGPESTRYCGGCHDPISLFSGTKNLFIETAKLTSLHGYQEGVSCLVCHAVRKVDLKGNANYVVAQPARYMFELESDERPTAANRFMRDFLIRAYPRQHVKDLSKTLFKTPEYCAACHKQFVDKEINHVGWVSLQNQYDNWKQSRWNHPGNPQKTIECRECHMPLVASSDPASGQANDYNHWPNDGKHRSHRFVAANQMMPTLLKLPGWQKQVELTDDWLQGKYAIPEIADKWAKGPAVTLELLAPHKVLAGQKVDLRVLIGSNKVGHDFPTGPLDLIQAWIKLVVTDDAGKTLFITGAVNEHGFIQPGSFMFKAEPVDQYGNLIDHHNLWEMVGVRYRRSIFPGYSDTAEFSFLCPQLAPVRAKQFPQSVSYQLGVPRGGGHTLHVEADLCYRKLAQTLVDFLFGERSGLTAPITVMTSAQQTIEIESGSASSGRGGDGGGGGRP